MKHALRLHIHPTFRFYTLAKKSMILVAVVMLAQASIARARMTRLPESFRQPVAALSSVAQVEMPSVDVASLKAQDARRPAIRGGLFRFATPIEVSYGLTDSGSWEVLVDGSRLWRLRIVSPGALSLNLGILDFDLPAGTSLWIYSPDGERIEGPYTTEHRNAAGQFWTPMIATDELVVEVHVAVSAAEPKLEIGRVNHGYRFFGADA